MTTNAQELAEIRERAKVHWSHIPNVSDAIKNHWLTACTDRAALLAIVDRQAWEIAEQTTRANNYEQSSQEHAQRAEELAAKLERVEGFALDLERKGKECRKHVQEAKNSTWVSDDLQTIPRVRASVRGGVESMATELQYLRFRSVYPGHPITVALAIVLKYPSLLAAEERRGDFVAALGDTDITGSGGAVRSALSLLRYATVDGWTWPQLLQWSAYVWASCDDQKTERPTQWRKGQDQADSLAEELRTKLFTWGKE